MKRRSETLIAAILATFLLGFMGPDFLLPVKCEARDEGPSSQEKKGKTAKGATNQGITRKGPAPAVTVATPVSILAKKLSVTIMGAGYEPGQEVRLLFTDGDGLQTDIGYALEPMPKANNSGAWSTTWTVDQFIVAKVVQAGVFTLTVTNHELKPLAHAAIAFKEASAPADKKSEAPAGSKAGDKPQKKSEGN